MEGSYHRRELKAPAIAFSSSEGRKLFCESMEQGHLENYFMLAEHYQTQAHPAFCGISSLAMTLNALLMDPKRVWQGVWRWYDETMLGNCESYDKIKKEGVTLGKLACFAKCNRASVELKYAVGVTLDQFRADVIASCSLKWSAICSCCGYAVDSKPDNFSCCCCQKQNEAATSASALRVIIVSYHRGTLNQTGTGHFSPIGGYHAASDSVLIMDVARFKYPPHWVPLPLLFQAMGESDPSCGKSRGYMIVGATDALIESCCGGTTTVTENPVSNSSAIGHVDDSSGDSAGGCINCEEFGRVTDELYESQLRKQCSSTKKCSEQECCEMGLEALLSHCCKDCSCST